MSGLLIRVAALALILSLLAGQAWAARIKDVADFRGVRNNFLWGYGLVVGLNKTGDGNSNKVTRQAIVNMLENMGMTVTPDMVKSGNCAVVVVTANLPPFAKAGTTVDITVNSVGDAKSLQGGTLLLTPLRAGDNQIYVVAQGPVSLGGGYSVSGGGDSVQKNHPTVGVVPSGGIVEREVDFCFGRMGYVELSLRVPDFTTVSRVGQAINRELGENVAGTVDAATVRIDIPREYQGNLVALVAKIENIEVRTDSLAKVVVNERTGTVVMGENVRIGTVAVAHGNLNIQVQSHTSVSQPQPLSGGTTQVIQNKDIYVTEGRNNLFIISGGPTIDDLVRALNAVGASPRDLIAILQAIKAAGALEARLEII